MNDADSELLLDTTSVDESSAGVAWPETAPDEALAADDAEVTLLPPTEEDSGSDPDEALQEDLAAPSPFVPAWPVGMLHSAPEAAPGIEGGAPAAAFEDPLGVSYFELLALARAELVPGLLAQWQPKRRPEVVGSGSAFGDDYYGNGADGDVTVSATTTLTRDMFYRNLTIQNGGRLKTGGFGVYVLEKLTLASGGKLDADGEAGAAGSGSTGGAGGAGGGRSTAAPFLAVGGNGGAGGSSGGGGTSVGTPGAGGTGLTVYVHFAPAELLSGCGGGGGEYIGDSTGATEAAEGESTLGPSGFLGGEAQLFGGTPSLGGGGGGGGGGVVFLRAHEIDNAGLISAEGGDGGAGASSADGAGGPGGEGGGGFVLVFYTTASGSGVGTLSSWPNGVALSTQVNV